MRRIALIAGSLATAAVVGGATTAFVVSDITPAQATTTCQKSIAASYNAAKRGLGSEAPHTMADFIRIRAGVDEVAGIVRAHPQCYAGLHINTD